MLHDIPTHTEMFLKHSAFYYITCSNTRVLLNKPNLQEERQTGSEVPYFLVYLSPRLCVCVCVCVCVNISAGQLQGVCLEYRCSHKN
jgi:hypothetical protein